MRLLVLIVLVALIIPASACTDCGCTVVNNVNVENILSQVQWMTQQQRQEQSVNVASGTTNSWIQESRDFIQESATYSRLLYPGEVIPFPITAGQDCTLLSGLPIAFYTIDSGNGTYDLIVQTLTARPEYDPVFHRMEFGQVPVIDKIDYWTMKAKLRSTGDADFCVVDNRAPTNGYTTIEVTITQPSPLITDLTKTVIENPNNLIFL